MSFGKHACWESFKDIKSLYFYSFSTLLSSFYDLQTEHWLRILKAIINTCSFNPLMKFCLFTKLCLLEKEIPKNAFSTQYDLKSCFLIPVYGKDNIVLYKCARIGFPV